MLIIILFIIIIIVLLLSLDIDEYNQSDYKEKTNNGYFDTFLNSGTTLEYVLYEKLNNLLNENTLLIPNVYIKKDNKTTEIDLILVHNTGIYVIESKNYSGWIYGSENQKQWTQTFSKNQKYKFSNPILQNQHHISYLKDFLNLNSDYFISYIVFGKKCRLKSIYYTHKKNLRLLSINDLIYTMTDDFLNKDKILTDYQTLEIYIKLLSNSNVSDEIKKQHIENIKNNLS